MPMAKIETQSQNFQTRVVGESAMVAFGRGIGEVFKSCVAERGLVVFLEGDLGAGKTTLSRGILTAYGHSGAVKSPTYTLVEPYEFAALTVYHFDLYRLGDPEELEYLGIRDYFGPRSICLLEWPARGEGFLPSPDLTLKVSVDGEGRNVNIQGHSALGQIIISAGADTWSQ